MLPIKTRSIFKSRWIALLWAGGIVWTAAEFAQGQPHGQPAGNGAQDNSAAPAPMATDVDGNPVSASDVAAAKAAIAAFGH